MKGAHLPRGHSLQRTRNSVSSAPETPRNPFRGAARPCRRDARRGVPGGRSAPEQEAAQPSDAPCFKGFFTGKLSFRNASRAELLPRVTATKLLLNIESLRQSTAASLPADGVGLLRTEFIFSGEIGTHPMHLVRQSRGAFCRQTRGGMSTVARAFFPRPVLARFSDFHQRLRKLNGGQELEPSSQPDDRMERRLPLHLPDCEEGFRLECRAVKKVRDEMGNSNLSVIIPLSAPSRRWSGSRPSSLRRARFRRFVQDLAHGGRDLCCLPGRCLASLVDGITIGTNDLTQLILGVDRTRQPWRTWGTSTNAIPRCFTPFPS